MHRTSQVLNGWTVAAVMLLAQAGAVTLAEEVEPAPLIQNLNADNFDQRNAAFTKLAKMGEGARKALEAALAANPPTEARRGIERLLEKLLPKRVLYAKVLLPGNLADDPNPKVEAWIAKDLKLEDGSDLHAISDWCVLTEDATTRFMSEIRCGIPLDGRIERKDGKITVHFTIHGPMRTPVIGDTVDDELGVRTVATVGDKVHPRAYVALMVGPEPKSLAAYQKVPEPKAEAEAFKP